MPEARSRNATISILVADDEDNFREMLVEYLTLEGYQVSQAADGAEAFERLKQDPFHLILLDINMPFLSGPEVVSRLENLGPTTRIIFTTGEASEQRAQISVSPTQSYSVLRKPIKLATLSRYLETLVDELLENRHRVATGAGKGAPAAAPSVALRTVLDEREQKFRRARNAKVPVLLADDDDPFREMLREHLEAEVFSVVTAENGEVALERLRAGDYRLIVLDINMPGMSGLEVVDQLGTQAPETQILFVTGEASREQLDLAYASARSFSVLRKPFKLATFSRYLDTLVSEIFEKSHSRELKQSRAEAWEALPAREKFVRRLRSAATWLHDSMTLYVILLSLLITILVIFVAPHLYAPVERSNMVVGAGENARGSVGFERRQIEELRKLFRDQLEEYNKKP